MSFVIFCVFERNFVYKVTNKNFKYKGKHAKVLLIVVNRIIIHLPNLT